MRAEPILRIPFLVLGPLCIDPPAGPQWLLHGLHVAVDSPSSLSTDPILSPSAPPAQVSASHTPGGSVTLQTLHPAPLCSHGSLYDLQEEKSCLLLGRGRKGAVPDDLLASPVYAGDGV